MSQHGRTPDSNSALIAIFAQLGSITASARGALAEHVRDRRVSGGTGTMRLGPDFKHQIRDCGRKVSTRIPAFCMEKLRGQKEEAKRLDALAAPIAFIAISEDAALRAAFAPKNHDAHAPRKIPVKLPNVQSSIP